MNEAASITRGIEDGTYRSGDIKYQVANLVSAYYPNPSGYRPLEHKVIIEPITVEEKTKGGLYLPETVQDNEQFKQTRGRIVAVSPFAFNYVTPAEWDASGTSKPKPGDLVLYARYAGIAVKGQDGKEYTIANDQDLCSVIEE